VLEQRGVMRRNSRGDLEERYFQWMYDLVCPGQSYRKLFRGLYSREFTWDLEMDRNRAADGVDLRYRFAYLNRLNHVPKENDPCTVLEMMIALAIRCEDQIMTDPESGDRTGKWFFEMVDSLGLRQMNDDRYDEEIVDTTVSSFLSRSYSPDGTGGLFRVPDCPKDMRNMEIWYQLMWYLNTVA